MLSLKWTKVDFGVLKVHQRLERGFVLEVVPIDSSIGGTRWRSAFSHRCTNSREVRRMQFEVRPRGVYGYYLASN